MSEKDFEENSQPSACRKTVDASVVKKAIVGLFAGVGTIAAITACSSDVTGTPPPQTVSTSTIPTGGAVPVEKMLPATKPSVTTQEFHTAGVPVPVKLQAATKPSVTTQTGQTAGQPLPVWLKPTEDRGEDK